MNLKQIQVAKLLGISNKTISGYENGVSQPDTETLAKLADIYETSIDYLVTGKMINTKRNPKILTDRITEEVDSADFETQKNILEYILFIKGHRGI